MILPIYLPIELTNLILEFSGYHKLRNGQYMTQLSKTRLIKINIKIQSMPKLTNGYVKITVTTAATNTNTNTNKIETTMILFNSTSSYNKLARL